MLNIEVVTPERTVAKVEADSLTVPTVSGEITILPRHIPLVSMIKSGVAILRKGREESYLALSPGFIQVKKDGEILILVESADRAEELDLQKIEAAKERARQLLLEHAGREDVAFADAAAAMERELARLKVARKHATRSGIRIQENE
ncbi:ATP synthase F1 subunit epsilon [Patescibacteria group bacterium]|nr:MAG: ATP synthase F1 subunit epsilon [Patescibacteria group bacterium]